jgi:surfeit locus 1 family protein
MYAMPPLELTRRGVLGTVVVLLVAAACVYLGLWQLDRRARRLERNRIVAERMADEALRLTSAPTDTTGLAYRRAVVEGAVDDDRAIILAGRSLNGAPGVHVLSPFRVGGGAVLINRGWLPAPDGATVELGPVRLNGTFRAEGVLMPFPAADLPRPSEGFQTRWFRVDGAAIRRQYPYPVAHLFLRATSRPVPSGTDAGLAAAAAGPEPLDAPVLDSGPHLSYAIQWFSFAAIAVIGWAVVVVQQRKERSGVRDAEPGAPGPAGT